MGSQVAVMLLAAGRGGRRCGRVGRRQWFVAHERAGRDVDVVTYEPVVTRPDLPIPLAPLGRAALLARRYLLRLRGPDFAGAYHLTLAIAGQGPLIGCSAFIAICVIGRALALLMLEQRQRSFEQQWAAAQSEVLRRHPFEVLRFTVQGLTDQEQGERTYNLTGPADVRDLLRRREDERRLAWLSRVRVEFTYLAGDGTTGLAEVRRYLTALTFLEGWASQGRAWIRFPEARYLVRSVSGRRPAQRASWQLSGPVMIAVCESAQDGVTAPAAAPEGSTESSELGSAR
jgi:hypothetical protein